MRLARCSIRSLAWLTVCLTAQNGSAQAGPPSKPSLPEGTPAYYTDTKAPEPVIRMSDALLRAYWTHPQLLAERARTRGADYRLPQARAQYGPRIDLEAGHAFQRTITKLPGGGDDRQSGWASTAAAILTQPLFTFGRNAAGERTAQGEIEFQHAQLRAVEGQVLLNVIATYAGVLRDRAGLQIADENLAILRRELDDNRLRLAAQETTLTDVQQVETRVALGRTQVLAAQRAVASSEALFLSAVGAKAGALEQPNPLVGPSRSLEEAYALALAHNPVLVAASSREKVSRAQRAAARAERLPRIDLRARADNGTSSPFSNNLRQTDLRAEVVLGIPLFDSGLRAARVSEADEANDADWRLIDSAVRDNRAEVADAWNEWSTLQASLGHFEAATTAARAAYEGALLQERAGLRTTLDVIDLARELLLARSNFNDASANAYVAQARLLFAIGLLEHDNLFPGEPRYDAGEHYRNVRNNGDIPLLTGVLSAVDAIGLPSADDRPTRDPAAPLSAQPAALHLDR